ncbi:MAG: Rne/Rng family ribonuclease [Pseudomonadales bacterium]|nr:Rne/Rng family ribonuclease [Pseudomonadales bacterium]
MTEELLINVTDFETRVALTAGGALQEVHLARAEGYSLTGNIYLGRVERIVPGMQAAFVNIGLERPGFLHVRDIEGPRLMQGEPEEGPPDIRDLLHEGQQLMVQVAKDPIASKGARLTAALAIASRYVVLMPFNEHIGVSQRIEDEVERERLRRDVEEIRGLHGLRLGFILRTAAEGVARAVLDTDMRVLARLWEKVLEKKRQVGCPSVVYQEIPLHIRVMRDLAGPRVEHIRIDHVETYQRVLDFVRDFLPEFIERVHLYQDRRPLFERYGIEDELTRALASRVPLKSGGHIVIEQTEAMITVDVNTGGFLGVASLEETVFRTNLEAAQVIPRQLRLRNLGGIIVIDFIDMEDEDHRRQVLRTLERACEGDPARVRFDGFSSLGLVLMSRKRTRESLIQQLCEPCPACAGTGFVKTAQSTCIEVFRAILQDARGRREVDARSSVASPMEYLIRACDAVVDRLLDEDADQLQALSREIGRAVRLQVEPSYGAGQFDIVLVQDMRRSG